MMKKIGCAVVLMLALVSCNKETDYVVTIHTRFGDMKVLLYDETPLHKENFIKLAKEGRYDSTIFHRVIKGFMVQGGNIDAKEGTTPERQIPAEFRDQLYHAKGSLAAARIGGPANPDKESSWCQFYVVHGKKFSEAELTVDQVKLNQAISQLLQYESNAALRAQFLELQARGDFEAMNKLALDNVELAEKEMGASLRKSISPERLKLYTEVGGAPHLDGGYTVFGKVVEGIEVVDAIAEQTVGNADKPLQDVFMTVEVEEVKRKEITKKYGFIYPEE